MPVTISADDPRTIRAIEIAARASDWLAWHTRCGELAYRVPSQRKAGLYYLVTNTSCECPDFVNAEAECEDQRACKHVLAVRLHDELVRAQRLVPQLPSAVNSGGHLRLVYAREST